MFSPSLYFMSVAPILPLEPQAAVGDATLATVEADGVAGGYAAIGDATLATVEAEGELLGSYYIVGDATLATVEAEGAATNEDVTEAPAASLAILGYEQTIQTANPGSTDISVAVPTADVGDLLILFGSKSMSVADPPAGWTTLNVGGLDATSSLVAYRIVDGTEPATVTVTRYSSSVRSGLTIFRVVGHDPVTPFDTVGVTQYNANALTCNFPAVTFTSTGGGIVLHLLSTNWDGGLLDEITDWDSTTEIFEEHTSGDSAGTKHAAGTEEYLASGATTARTWTQERGLHFRAVAVPIRRAS